MISNLSVQFFGHCEFENIAAMSDEFDESLNGLVATTEVYQLSKTPFDPGFTMPYKIELRYSYGWDDAGWTDDTNLASKPTRFESVEDAQVALDEFFTEVKGAVSAKNIDSECLTDDYRIVAVNE